jgi:hypothetical protein
MLLLVTQLLPLVDDALAFLDGTQLLAVGSALVAVSITSSLSFRTVSWR